ncbi:class I SAM-dependent methyltransferase, partial [Candidatus Pelagibacter sp.]|nr:class I SAM-dependent methyltransferase [Candidatus Pelagibacter sp.]
KTSNVVFYDLIYIDGSHHYKDVLNDARNSYNLLNKNGYLIFDDFLWNFYSDPNENPVGAIKVFLKENFFYLKIVSIGYQIILQKI